jgi:hypothetical protein
VSISIIITLTGGYFDRLGMVNIYRKWLTEKGIEFSFINSEIYNNLPSAVILNNEIDATAFKLKFGI